MLSFQQKESTQSTFPSNDSTVPTTVHRNPARSIVIDAPNAQNHTLTSKVRRERYLTDLGGKYISRWDIVTGNSINNNDQGALEGQMLERAFYASMPISLERRQNMSHNILTDDQEQKRTSTSTTRSEIKQDMEEQKENERKTEKNVVIDAGTQCWEGTMMHDWSLDAIRTDSLEIKGRPHTLCKYTHPCNDGHTCVPVADKPRPSITTVTSDRSSNVVAAGGYQGGYAFMEELSKRIEARKNDLETDGNVICNKVETIVANRQRKHRLAHESDLKKIRDAKDKLVKENDDACTRLIERTRAMRNKRNCNSLNRIRSRRNRSTLIPEEDEDFYNDVDSVSCTTTQSSDEAEEESGSGSTTFSDEKEQEKPLKYDYDEEEEHLDPVTLDTKDEKTASCQEKTIDAENGLVKEKGQEESKEAEKEEEKEKETPEVIQVVRQSNTEVMVPICEPSDTFNFFEQLECPYIMQWADEEHKRLHIYRRYYVYSRSYMLYKQRETRFQLITSIEVV